MFGSLLWLENSIRYKIDGSVIKDLGLHSIYEKLITISEHNEAVIYSLCMDMNTISYRQEIAKDLFYKPQLLQDLMNNLESFTKLKPKLYETKNKNSHFYELINLVITVETAANCLSTLYETLHYHTFSSQGLLNLKENVTRIVDSGEYRQMVKDLKEIRYIFNQIQSAEVSMNLSYTMRPVEAQVTQVNDHRYRYPKAFRKVADTLEQDRDFLGKSMKSYIPVFGIGILDFDILDELEYAFRKHKSVLVNFLKSYQKLDVEPYIILLEEMTFYEASYELFSSLSKEKLPMCFPKLLPLEERKMQLKDFYSVRMAYYQLAKGAHNLGNSIVLNDLTMDDTARIFILTGANRGGKTTVTQAIGQVQVFAQLGLPVAAKEAEVSLIDQIFTHFPVAEKETVDMGRLGKECQMFSEMYRASTQNSLFLLNEAFSGTSYLESLKIAEEAVKAVKFKGARMVFNTHLHELGTSSLAYNQSFTNDATIVSLVTEIENEQSTYKVHIGEPLGKSYAKQIAEKYGVTYEQLVKGDQGGEA